MRITVLIENTACQPGLYAEHGLSLFIETKENRILFDSGQTEAFAKNAEKLGIDLSETDLAVLSHGHYDHGGGLARFFEINKYAPVYLRREVFEPHYNRKGRYNGLDPGLLKEEKRFVYTEDVCRIGKGLVLSSGSREYLHPVDAAGLSVKIQGFLRPDDFRHEQFLLIEEDGRRILFSGCSHKGILNIVHWFQPDVLIGGFHFMNIKPDDAGRKRLAQAAEELCAGKTMYYTGHCTGEAQYRFLKERMGKRLEYLSGGTVLEF